MPPKSATKKIKQPLKQAGSQAKKIAKKAPSPKQAPKPIKKAASQASSQVNRASKAASRASKGWLGGAGGAQDLDNWYGVCSSLAGRLICVEVLSVLCGLRQRGWPSAPTESGSRALRITAIAHMRGRAKTWFPMIA